MKNRRCEGVVTVDLPSILVLACLSVFMGVMGVDRCMGVYGCIPVAKGIMGVQGFSNVNQRQRVL